MAIKTKEFEMFFTTFRTTQFSAVSGVEFLDKPGANEPQVILSKTEVKTGDGWKSLDNRAAINDYVKDSSGAMQPRHVLSLLTSHVMEFNFGFLSSWDKIKVPSRFRSNFKSVESGSVRPVIASIVQEGLASLRELEEYYSVDDAFKMLDILTAKAVNSALANEEAMERAKEL